MGAGQLDKSGPREIIPPADWQTAQHGVRMRYENGVEMNHAAGDMAVTFYGKEGIVKADRGRFEATIGGRTIEKGEGPLPEQLDRAEKEFLPQPKVRLYHNDNHIGATG